MFKLHLLLLFLDEIKVKFYFVYVFIPFQAELLNAFHINPEFLSTGTTSNHEVINGEHLYASFGMQNLNVLVKGDDDDDDDMVSDEDEDVEIKEKKVSFQKWLKKVFQPSHQRIFGDGQLNPVFYFHLTKLSPGYIGGVISGLTYT